MADTESNVKEEKSEDFEKKPDFNKKLWINVGFILILIAIIVFTIFIRTQNVPQLKDITTGNYTLGPDLDPFFYLRLANEIKDSGAIQNPDMMRQAPLGTPSYKNLMPYSIFYLYKILDVFFNPPIASVEFSAVIIPVIFFSLTLIVFFFFIRKLFSFVTTKTNATITALIATAFYSAVPEMLHRTVAGIPEIESLGMLFFWLAFLCLISAWQCDKIKKIVPLAVLSGIFTGAMSFTWGGFRYIFMTFALTSFLIFFFEKQKKKNFLIYSLWLIPSIIFIFFQSKSIMGLFTDIPTTGIATITFFILFIDLILFQTKLRKIKEKIKLPENILSIIMAGIIGLIIFILINPSFIANIYSTVIERMLYPYGRGRIGLTVAENRAPYFTEITGSFTKLFFWLFFFGTLVLFYEATKHFNKKNKTILNIFFILFIVSFIFSRISPTSLLNGENFISRLLYFGGLILFLISLIFIYVKAHIKRDEKTIDDFKNIHLSYILLLSFIFWMIMSMRGAVRLFFIVSPALIIAASFLPVKIAEYSLKIKDSLYKILLWCIVVAIAIMLVITFVNYTKITSQSAKYTIPGPYYQQWQKAMEWVRENTPENSIFVHWWDYGYWIETLGKRPTVTDGGHVNPFWDHTTARYLMNAQNEKTALQLCKAHNVSYFLIDSTDIGKYPAYGSIGSNESGIDRLSWINTFVLDEKQTQETRNETVYVYVGGSTLDEDMIWQNQLFPRGIAGIGGLIMTTDKETKTIKGVDAVLIYNNKQFRIPIKYIYMNNAFMDVAKEKDALNSILYIIPRITQQGLNNMGAAFYISEKAMKTEWVRLYLFEQSDNFELVHKEPALYVQQLRDVYNITINDFILANDLLGPIKIWKVNYPEDIPYYREYLQNIPPENNFGALDYLGV